MNTIQAHLNMVGYFRTLPGRTILLCLGATASLFANGDLIDPTQRPGNAPSVLAPEITTDFELNALVSGTQRNVAVINGQRVRPGDRLGEHTVVRVGQGVVTLKDSKSGELKVLALGSPSVRRPSTDEENR